MLKIFDKNKTFLDVAKRFKRGKPEVDKWVVSDFVLKKLVPVVGIHPFPLDELTLIASVVCWYKPEYIFEWGTNIGKSARIFYEINKSFRLDCRVYSIDLPDNAEHAEHPGKLRGKLVKNFKDVKLLVGDGLIESLKLVGKIKKNKKVLFFLDGDHGYESVKRELSSISEKRPGALIAVHDTFYQTDKSGYNIGPFNAVKELLKKKKHYQLFTTNLGLPGMSILMPKD